MVYERVYRSLFSSNIYPRLVFGNVKVKENDKL